VNVYLFAAVILLLPALCTALGAAGVFLVRRADEPRTRRMLCGMAAGAFGQSAKEKNAGGMSAKMTPSAVLVIQNGMTKVVNIKHQDALTKVLDMAPDLVNKFVGGSTGAVKVNNAVRAILPELLKDFQVVHLCGKGKTDKSKTLHRMIIAHDRMSDVSGNDRLLFNFF
jgi:hypothetical protein